MSDDGFVFGNAKSYYNKKFWTILFFIEWVIPLIFFVIVLIFAAFNYPLHSAFWWIPAIWLGVSVIWTIVRKTFLNEL